ncbi:unnamed protein product [Rhodiola kirilowii]
MVYSSHMDDRIIPLNFDDITNHNARPETNVGSSGQHKGSETVLIINVSDPDVGRQMCEACEKWGVFQVVGHGLPLSFLNEVEAETRRLFRLPRERKLLAVTKPGEYAGYGLPTMSKFYPTEIWSEGFTIRGSPAQHVSKLWLDDVAQCNKFCNVMKEYQKKVDILAKKITTLMLTSQGLTDDDLTWMKAVDNMSQSVPPTALRLNSYPICPNPSQTMGMAPHTDTSFITLLYQGNVGGLEVEAEGGEWVRVRPVEGALVVNVGDLMHIFSNGRLKNVTHRVTVNGYRHRISLGYFFGPPRDVEVAPMEKLVQEGWKRPMYRPVTWDEYMKLKHTFGQKALDMIRN